MNKPAILGGRPPFDTLFPINRPTLPDAAGITAEFESIISSGILTNDEYVKKLEAGCVEYLSVKHAIAVSCCTSGLMLTIQALKKKRKLTEETKETGEVIVPSFTFPATVHALIWNNLTPVFVDCDPETFNINPELIEEKITANTIGIIAVYIFGNPPQMDKLEKIAARHQLKLISDAAHAFGAKYKGISAGNFGNAEVFSLAPTKIMVSAEGGIIATNDDELADRLRIAREYGNPGDYNCLFAGLNARMSEIHALLGLKCLGILDDNLGKRQGLIKRYKSGLQDIPGIAFQKILPDSQTTYNYFSILVDKQEFGLDNDNLYDALHEENIMTRKYFFPPVHKQIAYEDYYNRYKNELPVTDSVCQRILCLPLFSHMDQQHIESICHSIRQIYEHRVEIKICLREINKNKKKT